MITDGSLDSFSKARLLLTRHSMTSGPVAQGSLQSSAIPIFGPRGLPCVVSGSACPYLNAGSPVSYLLFIQNTQNNRWEAVTLNPAARIREWAYDTKSSTWSPLN